MTDFEGAEPLSNSSDSSFVILGQSSLHMQENERGVASNSTSIKAVYDNLSNINFLNKSALSSQTQDRTSVINSISEENVQEKLNQVLRENYQLRETLSQNNLALKSQLDTFIMWQQEVLKTHETHKQKFLETKDLILKLQAENVNLKKQLEGGSSTFCDGGLGAQAAVKNETANISDGSNVLERTIEELNAENENLKEENQRLNKELKLAKSEILKTNTELEDMIREINFLKQENEKLKKHSPESFTGGSLPNSEARAQISNLFKQLEEERGKVSKLKEQIGEANKATEKPKSESELGVTEVLSQYIHTLDNLNVSLDRQNQRFNSLQSWVNLAEENVNGLGEKGDKVGCFIANEIKQLKSHLSQEENDSRKKQESLLEIKGQYYKLLEDYKVLQEKLGSLGGTETSIQKYKDEIAALLDQLKVKDADLISKQEECDKLKADIDKLNLECEEIAILKVQAELYQSDFNCEREARERLAGEKEELTEQIRILQTKLDSLEQGNGEKKETKSSPLATSEKKCKYVCPKCMFSFSDLQRCEDHIDECLNIHFYP